MWFLNKSRLLISTNMRLSKVMYVLVDDLRQRLGGITGVDHELDATLVSHRIFIVAKAFKWCKGNKIFDLIYPIISAYQKKRMGFWVDIKAITWKLDITRIIEIVM